MPAESLRMTFRYALGDRVRALNDPRCWVVEERSYHQGSVSCWVQYLLVLACADDAGGTHDAGLEYEANLQPWEDTP